MTAFLPPEPPLDGLGQHVSDTWKAGALIDLTVISLLVDKGILSADEIIVRLETLQNRMDRFQGEGVTMRVNRLLEELRSRPGASA